MDGYLKIRTRADITDLKKNLTQAKKELEQFKKEAEKLNNKKLEIEAKLNLDDAEYKRKLDEINRKRQSEIQVNSNSRGVIDSSKELKINNKYDNQIANLGLQMEKNIARSELELEKIERRLGNNSKKQTEWNSKISDTEKKLKKVDLKDIDNNVKNVGSSITSTIKKVGKWALAIFGVRSAYMAVRSAAGTLSQYNKKLGTDLEYIKYMIASSFEGVLEKIVGLVYKVLQYVNYLAKAWFNVDLFSKKASDRFKSANKSAKELKKTTSELGFDELNKLQDNSDGNETSVAPSMDLGNMDGFEPPAWLKGIKDFFQPVIDILKGIYDEKGIVGVILAIGGAFAGWLVLKKVIGLFAKFGSSTKGISADFTGLLDSLGKSAELIALFGGLSLVIESISGLIETFSQSGLSLGETAGLLGIVLGELAGAFLILMGAMTLLEPSWQSIAAAAVIFGGLALVLNSVSKLIDTFSKSGLSLNDVIGVMSTILVTIVALMGSIVLLGPAMTAGLLPFLAVVGGISALLITMSLTLPIILDACSKFIQEIAPVVIELLKTMGKLITDIIYALGTVLPPIINAIGDIFTKIFDGIAKVIETVGNTIVKIMKTAQSLITTVLQSILNFINELGPAINRFVDGAIQAVTKLINFLISGIEYMINTLIIDAINGLISAVNNIPLVDIPKIPRVSIARFKPVLMATGGIIDVPKRGVPLANNVVGGEAGAEGVLPLTNQATMERLGREIGKWITLNIDLTGKIDMRVLYREFIKYQNEQSFARNGV